MKKAILTFDVEDWYHLEYFSRQECNTNISLLDGLETYVNLLNSLSVPSSFFVLGEIAKPKLNFFRELLAAGHDIGSHGWDHRRPMTLGIDEFREDLRRSIDVMREINGERGFGYRAPCFSIDRARLDVVRSSGFTYDASHIAFENHPLYGSIDLHGFEKIQPFVYRHQDFFEFEATTLPILGKNIPICGGAYFRLLPWFLTKELIKKHIENNDIYVFYIHPFELSKLPVPEMPVSTSFLTKYRFSKGRSSVADKLRRLVGLLKDSGYTFTTFSLLQSELRAKLEG